MSIDQTSFKYFRNPHDFSTYTAEPQTCEVCQQVRAGYSGPFYSAEDIEFVCEECLATGRLAQVDATTNEGDIKALRKQIKDLQPQLTKKQLEELVEQGTAELEQRTPHLTTWQDFFWPVHCGDYCCFIKEAGKADLNKLAADGDGQSFFEEHLYDAEHTLISDIWEAIRADSPQDNSTSYSVGVYLFQCLQCSEYLILWDSD